jgi:predicted enzyme related to lactoylglutathione lyase
MSASVLRSVLLGVVPLVFLLVDQSGLTASEERNPDRQQDKEKAVDIYYLEIVTPELDETCAALERAHNVTFGEPVPEFGNARMTALKTGGRLGVRAPMGEAEQPVVRPYALVDDIETAVEHVKTAGGTIAMPPTEIPGQGTFAIYFLGGIQHGLWQM